MKRYIIVGGVAGGASAAARLRRLDEDAQIILVERGPYISFANCGLPYYAGDVIKDRSRLLVQTVASVHGRFNIDVRTESTVVAVHTAKRTVSISHNGTVYEEPYDGLILSPGAVPLKPPIPGIDSEKILMVRTIPDIDKVRAMADRFAGTGSAAIIGGGFIGIEMAENLRRRGMETTVIEAAPHILAPFDTDMVLRAEWELNEHGVGLLLQDGVQSFAEDGGKVVITTQSGRRLSVDFVVASIGIRPDTAFLRDSGIALNERGYIIVDETMATNTADVYAVGDAVQVRRLHSEMPLTVALAGPANHQGRIAANNLAGHAERYQGAQGTSIVNVFDLAFAATGENERALQARGQAYRSVRVYADNHAGYYPGSVKIAIKLLFAPDTGVVLGAQIYGADGVDKRIDVLATLLRQGGTVRDLAELELAYAPPFGSAKDAVNMAGFAAENVLDRLTQTVTYQEMQAAVANGAVLLDVRPDEGYVPAPIGQPLHIPLAQLRERLAELDRRKEYITTCKVGQNAYYGERLLRQHGFRVKSLQGGLMNIMDQRFTASPSAAPAGQERCAVVATDGAVPFDRDFDVTGISCPGPMLKLKEAMDMLPDGEVGRFTASDPGFWQDSEAWCRSTGNTVVHREKSNGQVKVWVRKGE